MHFRLDFSHFSHVHTLCVYVHVGDSNIRDVQFASKTSAIKVGKFGVQRVRVDMGAPTVEHISRLLRLERQK